MVRDLRKHGHRRIARVRREVSREENCRTRNGLCEKRVGGDVYKWGWFSDQSGTIKHFPSFIMSIFLTLLSHAYWLFVIFNVYNSQGERDKMQQKHKNQQTNQSNKQKNNEGKTWTLRALTLLENVPEFDSSLWALSKMGDYWQMLLCKYCCSTSEKTELQENVFSGCV